MLITGTFLDEISHDIPHQNWSETEWDRDFQYMKAMGIDTVILIRSGYRQWLTFPSEVVIREENAYMPPVDLLDMYLRLAERYGMQFYFGLYDSGKYWWDQGDYQKELDINLKVIDEVWEKYGHRKAFQGWYITQEVSRKTGAIIDLYAQLAKHCKTVSNGLPTLISPYIDGSKALLASQSSLSKTDTISLKQHEAEWDEIFSGIRDVVDIVAFQDGHVGFHELADFLSVNKNLADKYGLRSWTNSESFDRDMPIKFLPIKWEKLKLKLEAAHKAGMEKAITFEFSHFMSPQSAYIQAKHLYNRHEEYRKSFPVAGMKKDYAALYKNELLEKVIPFWMQHSLDQENGGYFTCLDKEGKVFDRDKFVWLQARQVWTFSMLYNELEQKKEWLEVAQHGARFLEKHGHDQEGKWYFALSEDGQALIQPYNIFSDCFATMAFGQLAKATADQASPLAADKFAKLASDTFHQILERQYNPKGTYNKAVPGVRPSKNFALPMILCNLSLEIEPLLEKETVEQTIRHCIHEVMDVFYNEESGLILENVSPDGAFMDTFDGRLLNPGHAIEAMWFILDLAKRIEDQELAKKAVERGLKMLDYGWDEEHGGIFYFMDIKGHPPQQLEWDQKLWWVHLETLVFLLKAYEATNNPLCWRWFEKVHAYTWERFPEKENGEWYGYLNRQGRVLLPLKGGKWKGCFHVPRALYQCWKILEKIG